MTNEMKLEADSRDGVKPWCKTKTKRVIIFF